ncbi:MAG: hypothetical protein IV090_05560 [Candidatus Sericytochromatia bacterium]|nr:hypothetical protein [Candidatus Sericytochromatia bacterium]
MKHTTAQFLGLMGLFGLLGLSACSASLPIQPSATPSPQVSAANNVNFANATSKRSLNLNNLGSLNGTSASNVSGSATGSNTAAPAANPESPAVPSAGGMAQPGISMPYYPNYGGGEFNQFLAVMAEESLFPGNASRDLSSIYEQSILPVLRQWDLNARLLESRGNTQPDLKDPNRYEYVYVPGLTAEKQLQLRPDWIFRFASTPRKETLTFYVTPQETRVYRVVWSEPNILIGKVKISVNQAVTLARQALSERNSQVDYPVYPMAGAELGANNTIIYDLPENLNWSVTLGQQGEQILYYLVANYAEAYAQPGVMVVPPLNSGSGQTGGGVTGSGTVVAAGTATAPVSAQAPSQPDQSPTTVRPPECQTYYQPYLYLSASASIDAVTGKVLSLNRPVRYNYNNAVQPCK